MVYTEREQVVEVLNRLFYYTDYQLWNQLKEEVFADEVLLDMTSLGALKAEKMTAQQICDEWAKGFEGLDAIHHQAGNYIIDINGPSAEVKAYARATHYKKDTSNGSTREFVGSYDFTLNKTGGNWQLVSFRFNVKYMEGNLDLS